MHNQINKISATSMRTINSVVPAHRTKHIKNVLATEWNLHPDFVTSVLCNHFKLYWKPSYLLAQLDHSLCDGTIYKDGRLFKVIFHKCSLADCIKSTVSQVAISFRVPKHVYEGAVPVALVSCAHQHQHSKR